MEKEKQIEEMADVLCDAKEHDCKGGNDCLCIKQAEAIYNAGYRKQNWISVEDRLPEASGYYLFATNGNPYCGFGNGTGVSYFMHKAKTWKKINEKHVTHWMPLPKPPMKGE